MPAVQTKTDLAFQQCVMPSCGATYDVGEERTSCEECGALLDIAYDWDRLPVPGSLKDFEKKWARRNEPLERSGVWRFRELLPFAPDDKIVTIGEGQTPLHSSAGVADYIGLKPGNALLQYEGMNPSGSFKDNGMTAAFTHAHMIGAKRAACASTGNTSASLALYCGMSRLMQAVIFIGSGKISYGKLSQALDYGALTVQIAGDFDDAMHRVRQVSKQLGIYLVNSVNPFRLEGQKTIMLRVLESLNWEIPDWIVVPGGNLGNSSSFGKAFHELKQLGLIDRVPRVAIINAAGANTLNALYNELGVRWNGGAPDVSAIDSYYAELDASAKRADTIASAIEINRPVNLMKCLRALECCDGVVREATDQQMLDAKARIAANGLGCEPASAASVAGAKILCEQGVIDPDERVVCVLTGHQLKDPTATVAYHSSDQNEFNRVLGSRGVTTAAFANRAVQVENELDAIVRTIQLNS
ncbi:threonine synthase [Botrimarina mediterranea]|uniref:Threonine synthase n=1 Tax=Botrimarina mediterranea TaxID=2528022 RepID=A0A518K9F6_9BACT|nr:threonine synthase [Botrimarina mediterranea]QDV74410.1 Threonine synthase [Botrimarina mediterranea]QDV79006.1 Threonine synthase [Planctomycetes bacterium K2D]